MVQSKKKYVFQHSCGVTFSCIFNQARPFIFKIPYGSSGKSIHNHITHKEIYNQKIQFCLQSPFHFSFILNFSFKWNGRHVRNKSDIKFVCNGPNPFVGSRETLLSRLFFSRSHRFCSLKNRNLFKYFFCRLCRREMRETFIYSSWNRFVLRLCERVRLGNKPPSLFFKKILLN